MRIQTASTNSTAQTDRTNDCRKIYTAVRLSMSKKADTIFLCISDRYNIPCATEGDSIISGNR